MLSRDSKPINLDLQKRAGYHFCRLIREIISLSTLTTKKSHHYLYDDLNEPRVMLNHLSIAFNLLEPKMRLEEYNREEFKIPASFYRTIQTLKTEATELTEQARQLDVNFELNKKILEQEKLQIYEKIKTEEIQQYENQITKQNAQSKQLNQLKLKLEQELRNAQSKLDGKCCNCFSCSITKETKALADAKEKLTTVENQLNELQNPPKEISASPVLIKLSEEKATIEQTIEKFINIDYPNQKNIIAAKQACNETAISQSEEKLKNKIRISTSVTNYLNMSLYLRTYACFIELSNSINLAFSKKYTQDHPATPNDKLVQLKSTIEKHKKDIDQAFDSLWCPHSCDRSGKIIYEIFSKLDKEDQQKFMKGQFDEKLLTTILPHQPGILLEDITADVGPFNHSTLFSPNSNATLNKNSDNNPKINPTPA